MPREVETTASQAAPAATGASPKIGRAAGAMSSARRAPCLLKIDPDRWQVFGGRLVPLPGDDLLVSGINGVKVQRGGVVNIDHLNANNSRAGWVTIPLSMGPLTDAQGERTYLRDLTGGGLWATAWEIVHPARPDLVECDVDGMSRWLRSLVDGGQIQRPRLDVLRSGLAAAKNEAAEMARLAKSNGRYAEDAERAEAAVKVWKAELEAAGASAGGAGGSSPKMVASPSKSGKGRPSDDIPREDV